MASEGEIYRLARQFRRELLRGERRAANEMLRAYGDIWRRIKIRLDVLLGQIRDARAAGEEPGISWLIEQGRLERLLEQVKAEMRAFADLAEARIVEEQRQAVEAAERHAAKMMQAALWREALVVGSFARVPMEALADLVGFLSDGTPLRRLLDELGPDASRATREALITGLATGQSPRVIARRVRAAFGGNLARALRVSRTEVLRSYREATLRSYQANDDVVSGWIWYSALGARTCAACWAMHGTKHRLNERLDDHPNGRCTAIPIVRGFEEEVPSGATLFDQQPEEVQRKILGHAGYEVYRAGAVKLEDFVGRRRSREWGTIRYTRSLRAILGPEEAKKWRRRAVFADRARALGKSDVATIGAVPRSVSQYWMPVSEQVVLTGERRTHYLKKHPEMVSYEGMLLDVCQNPVEVHRDVRDARMAILYRALDGDRFLRVALWTTNIPGLQNSVHSYRLAKLAEIMTGRSRGRMVWKEK